MIVHEFDGKRYEYYTPEEADQRGIDVHRDWRSAQRGDWVLSDDGMVVQILNAGRFENRNVGWVRIPTGQFLTRHTVRLTTERRKNRSSFLGKTFDPTDPNRSLTIKERRFVVAFLQSFDVRKAFAEATDRDPTTRSFRNAAYAYANRANVKMAIDEGMKLKLKGVGLDEEWFGAEIKRVVEEAPRHTDQVRALELVAKVLDLVTPQVQEKTSFVGIATQEFHKIAEERQELLADGNGRDVGERTIGGAKAPPGDEPGHGPVRETDIPESPVPEDPSVPQRDL